MLPNLPTLKAQCQMILDRHVSLSARAKLGAFSDVDRHVVHEGTKMRTIRADGSSDVSMMATASAEIAIDVRSTGVLSKDERRTMLDNMASQLAIQMQNHFYKVLDVMLEERGQTVDGKGGNAVDAIFKTFEKIELDFDAQGNQKPLNLAADEQTQERMRKAGQEIMDSPELREKFEALIEKKRGIWRAREASRKLVG